MEVLITLRYFSVNCMLDGVKEEIPVADRTIFITACTLTTTNESSKTLRYMSCRFRRVED